MNDINSPFLVHHFLEYSALRFPDKVALVHEKTRATYFELNIKANQLAHWLLSQGTKQGERVVIIFQNCLEYVISYYGILKAGAVAVPLSTDFKPEGIEPLLDELEPQAVIVSSYFERTLKLIRPAIIQNSKLIIQNCSSDWSSGNLAAYVWGDILEHQEATEPDIAMDSSALASIVYTSGSTGQPKGVMLTHGNIVSNVHSICQYLAITEKDIQIVVLPFFYVMGKSLLNTHVAAGGTVVINNKFAYPASVLKQMVDENVTAFSGVPSTYAYLLHRSPLVKYRDKLKTLRYCSQAGGHMSTHLKKELRAALPGHTKIYIMYGATEASARLTYLEPGRFEEKMGSIGKPIPNVALRIVEETGQEADVDRTGELVASGPNIMQGYWKDQASTAGVLDSNGYHTGDLGYRDKEGFFYVVGRKDNLLKVGGYRINPQEIEDSLMSTELLIEVVVLGLPDNLLGNKLVAVGSPINGDCSGNEILRLCARKLPKYKLPAAVKLVRSLPKNANGKIDRNMCLKLITSQGEFSENSIST